MPHPGTCSPSPTPPTSPFHCHFRQCACPPHPTPAYVGDKLKQNDQKYKNKRVGTGEGTCPNVCLLSPLSPTYPIYCLCLRQDTHPLHHLLHYIDEKLEQNNKKNENEKSKNGQGHILPWHLFVVFALPNFPICPPRH